jgi:hypothetical protein
MPAVNWYDEHIFKAMDMPLDSPINHAEAVKYAPSRKVAMQISSKDLYEWKITGVLAKFKSPQRWHEYFTNEDMLAALEKACYDHQYVDPTFTLILDKGPKALENKTLFEYEEMLKASLEDIRKVRHGAQLKTIMPGLREYVNHPILKDRKTKQPIRRPVESIIIDLNDTYKWSREQVADWLDTLDVDLTFKEDPYGES